LHQNIFFPCLVSGISGNFYTIHITFINRITAPKRGTGGGKKEVFYKVKKSAI
jgi:hypothetical protein